MSTGVKVAIGVSALAAALLIAVALFLLLLRRRRMPPHRRRRLIQRNNSSFASLGSPTPLVSAPFFSPLGPDNVPLTPPLPLRERRMLDTGSPARRRPSGFLPPTVLAPSLSKLTPISETIPSGLCPPSSTHCVDSSVRSSSGSSRAVSTPVLPHCSPLKSPLPSTQRHGDIGVAVGMVTHNPADGVVLDKDSRDLCELTDEYARESSINSWGSWRGGGGPGRLTSEEYVGGVVMKEGDLERLGGRY